MLIGGKVPARSAVMRRTKRAERPELRELHRWTSVDALFSRMYREKAACEQEFFTASSPRLASAAKAAPAASEIAGPSPRRRFGQAARASRLAALMRITKAATCAPRDDSADKFPAGHAGRRGCGAAFGFWQLSLQGVADDRVARELRERSRGFCEGEHATERAAAVHRPLPVVARGFARALGRAEPKLGAGIPI